MTAKPEWYPDWRGETCAIIASGPSTKRVAVGQLRDRMRVVAIKENAERLAPWADVVYGCDLAWWRNVQGLPKYRGLKVSVTKAVATSFPDIRIPKIVAHHDQLMLKPADAGTIGSGGNSGFQALNLVLQWGARRVLLIGFDLNDHYGLHWYGRNEGQGRTNPGEWNFQRWRKAFASAAQQLHGTGIEVLNASEFTSLTCFPKVTLEQALTKWELHEAHHLDRLGSA